MVFIRPTIVRNKEDAKSATEQKYLYVRGEELMRGIPPENSIDRYVTEVLGGSGPMGSAADPAR
jgi:general secretion pathway protein D